MYFKSVIFAFFTVFLLLFLSGCTSDNKNDDSSNGNNDWLKNYTPLHSIGTEQDNFWIDHPIDGPINHPQWIVDSLNNQSLVFVVHRHTCTWCDPQAKRVIALAEKYKDYVIFYDLDIDLGGDIMMKGYDVLQYDPDGPPHYIALTGIFTLTEKDGNKIPAWRTWEGDMTELEIETWIKDAIYYHHINKGEI